MLIADQMTPCDCAVTSYDLRNMLFESQPLLSIRELPHLMDRGVGPTYISRCMRALSRGAHA